MIETNVVVSDISGLNGAAAEEISNKLMTTVEALVKCGDIAELFKLDLRAMAAIKKIEHGSTSDGQKYNSFFGR